MNKDEIALILFLYTLVVIISSSRSFFGQIVSSSWTKNMRIQLQEPISTSANHRMSQIRMVKTKIMNNEKRS